MSKYIYTSDTVPRNGKTVYIAGPITGVDGYREEFDRYADDIRDLGYTVINPAKLPKGMTNAQYMKICFAMVDAADAVMFMSGWRTSMGATLEHDYCVYTGKPHLHTPTMIDGDPDSISISWLRDGLQEVTA